jgi:hypothetical protein
VIKFGASWVVLCLKGPVRLDLGSHLVSRSARLAVTELMITHLGLAQAN